MNSFPLNQGNQMSLGRDSMKHFILALSFFVASSAFAADGTSFSENNAWVKNVYANLFTNYHGATLSDPVGSRTLDHNGKPSRSAMVNFDSEFATGYRLSPSVKLGVIVPFFVYPFPTLGENMTLGDVGAKVSWKAIATDNFHLDANLAVQPPTSQYSRSKNIRMGIKATPSGRYDFDAIPLSLGAWTEVKEYVNASDKNLKLWALPYAEYQIVKNLAFNVGYEMQWYHYTGRPNGKIANYLQDLQPGLVWRAMKHLSINPYLQIYTQNKLNSDSTAFGVIANAALL